MKEPLEVEVGQLLRQKGLNLVLAESCTGGLVSHMITNVPGSSDYYLGGVCVYSYEAKERLLGVRHETIVTHGVVSRETALEMARGVRGAFCNDHHEQTLGVAITGIAGPGGGLPNKPVGLVWFGLSTPDGDWAWHFIWKGSRLEVKQQSADKALGLLIDYMKGALPAEA